VQTSRRISVELLKRLFNQSCVFCLRLFWQAVFFKANMSYAAISFDKAESSNIRLLCICEHTRLILSDDRSDTQIAGGMIFERPLELRIFGKFAGAREEENPDVL
jgi:hypothetical protein